MRAYFIYNSLSVVVPILYNSSCYHTFNASYHNHQTSVPFVETEDYIYFNKYDTYIFAWGNGKSDKRQWMEERGFHSEGRATQRQITDFFNTLSVYDQAHMINEGWYDFEMVQFNVLYNQGLRSYTFYR